ncbi:biotin transport system substrate-specific component [Bacillus sp. SLBN-46]|jgi:biotin transport system substrate-specific component|uniref:biotin transporter BioY n=1 Tax=Bacillus sp. SLBN-46 TaxID=3042283 RepID=UPI00285FFEB4|nr:biotin transporter BioY [Bacillus sp. SLBN-46]MDR6120479.1 biotin transport system substrate-specific component [Bacillus sp. SLBN-46]
MKNLRALDLTLSAMFVALMAIGANISTIAPFLHVGGVPITLQTFFAILAGAILGSRLGSIAMTVYMLVGLVGVPVFADFSGGLSILIKPTFGFILSYIFTAFIIGKIVEKKKGLATFIIAALIGMAVNYVFGTNWMYFAYKLWAAAPEGFTYKMAWFWMLAPLPKDIVLSVLAAFMAHRLETTVLSKGQFKHLKRVS